MESPRTTTIHAHAKRFVELLEQSCPPSRERSLAITNLEQAVMWADKALAA